MAKKRTAKTAAADIAGVTAAGPIDTAADMAADIPGASHHPNYDDIAQAAYLRYLNRGGGHGQDVDDWIEAERELKGR